MYIYINEELALTAGDLNLKNKEYPELLTHTVYGTGVNPHIQIFSNPKDTPDTKLEKYFLKATDILKPKYSHKRTLGIYRLGDAEAELIRGQSTPYCLKLKATSWAGLDHIETLKKQLWAGTILPTVNYEVEQRESHLLYVLKGLLQTRKLSKLQQYYLALRLMSKY